MVDATGETDPAIADVTAARRFNVGTQECLPPPGGEAHGSLDCPK